MSHLDDHNENDRFFNNLFKAEREKPLPNTEKLDQLVLSKTIELNAISLVGLSSWISWFFDFAVHPIRASLSVFGMISAIAATTLWVEVSRNKTVTILDEAAVIEPLKNNQSKTFGAQTVNGVSQNTTAVTPANPQNDKKPIIAANRKLGNGQPYPVNGTLNEQRMWVSLKFKEIMSATSRPHSKDFETGSSTVTWKNPYPNVEKNTATNRVPVKLFALLKLVSSTAYGPNCSEQCSLYVSGRDIPELKSHWRVRLKLREQEIDQYSGSSALGNDGIKLPLVPATADQIEIEFVVPGFLPGSIVVSLGEITAVSSQGRGTLTKTVNSLTAGDLNGDKIIDLGDVDILAAAYGSVSGESRYNPVADLNGDGVIDIIDSDILTGNFGEE